METGIQSATPDQADHLLRFFSNIHALHGFWDANIFYPEPLTLAYSEHLVAQAVQILPVYALTHNIILCYNLLFLSTFVLSGLGTFLFVREVTGSCSAGFAAGPPAASAKIAAWRIGSDMTGRTAAWRIGASGGLRSRPL